MTPAVQALKVAGVVFDLLEYEASVPAGQGAGSAAATALGIDPDAVYKTLVVELSSGELIVAVIPAENQLALKKLAKAAGAKGAVMADSRRAERATGYVTGGISPIGQKQALRTFVHRGAADLAQVFVSGGRRGLELALTPADLISVVDAESCDLCA
ncbi:MAG: Cys-tRNA(Pro) deacylase [Pseudomonadota bacterium]